MVSSKHDLLDIAIIRMIADCWTFYYSYCQGFIHGFARKVVFFLTKKSWNDTYAIENFRWWQHEKIFGSGGVHPEVAMSDEAIDIPKWTLIDTVVFILKYLCNELNFTKKLFPGYHYIFLQFQYLTV